MDKNRHQKVSSTIVLCCPMIVSAGKKKEGSEKLVAEEGKLQTPEVSEVEVDALTFRRLMREMWRTQQGWPAKNSPDQRCGDGITVQVQRVGNHVHLHSTINNAYSRGG